MGRFGHSCSSKKACSETPGRTSWIRKKDRRNPSHTSTPITGGSECETPSPHLRKEWLNLKCSQNGVRGEKTKGQCLGRERVPTHSFTHTHTRSQQAAVRGKNLVMGRVTQKAWQGLGLPMSSLPPLLPAQSPPPTTAPTINVNLKRRSQTEGGGIQTRLEKASERRQTHSGFRLY